MTSGSPKGHKKLTLMRRIAVNAHISGMTKKDAMIEAGYAPKTDPQSVFGRDEVKHEITRHQEDMAEEYNISREWIAKRLMKITDSNLVLAKFKKVMSDGQLDWDFTGATLQELALIDELTVLEKNGAFSMKIGVPSRQAALDALARIFGLNKDKLDLSGSLSLVERLQKGRDRVRGDG